MINLSKQDKKIFEYLTKLRYGRKQIPYMTVISKETGVSVATISRYARKKGFSNFAVLRDDYNNKRDTFRLADPKMRKLMAFIRKSEELFIIPSNSCYSLGFHFQERLLELSYKTFIRARVTSSPEELKKIPKNASVIFISLTAGSAWYERYINNMIPNRGMIISTKSPIKTAKHVRVITHLDKGPVKETELEIGVARGKLLTWLDQTITQLHIELLNEKKKG